jgi:hypothetical protein
MRNVAAGARFDRLDVRLRDMVRRSGHDHAAALGRDVPARDVQGF